MDPEMAKWLLAAVGSCTVAVVGAVAWLATLVFRIGHKYGAVEKEIESLHAVVKKVDEARERLERIPLLEAKLEMFMESHAEERRRFASEWPELKEKVTTLWERVFSLSNWRKSQGQFGE